MKTQFLVSKKKTQLYYKTYRLMLCREVVAVQCENNTKRTNILYGQNVKIDHVTCSKGNVHHGTGHGGPEGEYRYSSTLSLTSMLDGVGGQRNAPAALPPGKTRYSLYRGLGGLQGRCGRARKISPPPGFDPRTAQLVASRYTD
jgi:hypothetical protein